MKNLDLKLIRMPLAIFLVAISIVSVGYNLIKNNEAVENSAQVVSSDFDKEKIQEIIEWAKANGVGFELDPKDLEKPLGVGANAVEVKDLQRFLNAAGFIVAKEGEGSPGNESTYFGPGTQSALLEYQKFVSLPTTGYLDSETAHFIQLSVESFQLAQVAPPTQPAPTCAPGTVPVQFPPSPVTLPPLPNIIPPPNTPGFLCADYSYVTCLALKQIAPQITCSILGFDHHAIDIIEFTGPDGVGYICVIEPQGRKYYCMKKSEWDNLPGGWREWVKKTLCEQYYQFPPEKCVSPPEIIPYPSIGKCSTYLGQSCVEPGKHWICSNDPTNPVPTSQVKCKCDPSPMFPDLPAIHTCKWVDITNPTAPVTPQPKPNPNCDNPEYKPSPYECPDHRNIPEPTKGSGAMWRYEIK